MKKRILAIAAAAFLLAGCGSAANESSVAEMSSAPEAEEMLTRSEIDSGKVGRAQKKEETVTVRTLPDGTVKETIVEVELSGADACDFLEDRTTLSSIRNRKGEEEFLLEDGMLYWENMGETVTYEGASDGEIPFGVRIRYFLNGSEIEAGELAGKSGEVKICFEYENRTKETVRIGETDTQMSVPMTAISMAVLPEEKFSDIKVKNGRLVRFGDQSIAIGIAVPGLAEDLALADTEFTEDIELPDRVEITATANEFALDFTATIVSPGLPGEEEETKEETDLDKLFEDTDELADASGEMKDGAAELKDGADTFGDGLTAYTDGVISLADGAYALASGAEELQANSGALTAGAKELKDGIEALRASLAQVDTSALGPYAPVLSGLTEGLSGLSAGAQALESGIASYTGGVDALTEGALQLNAGANELADAGEELTDGYAELLDGIGSLKDGIEEFDREGIQELSRLIGTDLKNIRDRFRAAKDLDGSLNNFSGIWPDQEGSVRFLFESDAI